MRRQAWCAGLAALLMTGCGQVAPTPPEAPLAFEGDMSPEQVGRTIAAIEASPESVEPFQWAIVSAREFERGNRLRATFWFYMFQIRSRPWAEADGDGSGAAALRGSLNATLGSAVNEWVAADPALWQQVTSRAIAFEARLPLYPGRPDRLSDTEWRELVEQQRAAYAEEARAAFAGMDAEEVARLRRENGLPVGPLGDQGKPLAEAWR